MKIPMCFSTSKLRENICNLLDEVLRIRRPLKTPRTSRRLPIFLANPPNKSDNFIPHGYLKGDPDYIVHIDWSTE